MGEFLPEEGSWPLLNEAGAADSVTPEVMDRLWSLGWRHFGPRFFRYSVMWHEEQWKRVISLRLRLADWEPSRSQRRTLRRNEDLEIEIAPAEPGPLEKELFQRHKKRFKDNVPDELEDFLGEQPSGVPCECLQFSVRQNNELLAASFLDLGAKSCSGVYAVFDPDETKRRLGIYTMLLEIEHARSLGMEYYYLGYATIESSAYDYKKELRPLEEWKWGEEWNALKPDENSMPEDRKRGGLPE